MSRLSVNSLPAERQRGLIFSELFLSAQKVVENGGTLTNNAYVNSEHNLVLDGVSDWVQYSELLNVGTEDFTIIARIKSDSSPTDTYPRIFSNRNSGSSLGIAMYINTDDGNSLSIGIADGTNGWFSSGGADLFDDAWHTVAITCDRSGNATYYIDGASDGSADDISARSGNTDTANAPRIGAEADGGSNDFQGEIGYVKVFKGAVLTAKEIADYHNNSTYNYRNKALVDLRMGMAEHDPSNTTGTNIVVDGDMEATGVTNWNVIAGATLTKESDERTGGTGTQCLQIYDAVDVAGAEAGTNILTVGKVYKASGWVKSDGTADPRIYCGGSQIIYNSYSGSGDWEYFEETFTAQFTQFRIYRSGGGVWVRADDIVVEELESRTLDRSGKGNNATLGDGSTASTFPTKLSKRGYSFDGGDYLDAGSDSSLLETDDSSFSVSALFRTDDIGNFRSVWSKQNSTSASGGAGAGMNINPSNPHLDVYYYDTNGDRYILETTNNGIAVNNLYHAVFTFDNANSTAKLYLNGELEDTDTPNGFTANSAGNFMIGRLGYSPSWYWDGEIYTTKVWDFALTPLQIKDLHIEMLNSINDI